jgi:hypothetical protein
MRTLVVIAAALAIAPAPAFAGTARTFDLVTYTAPDGFTVDTSAADHVLLARIGQKSFCLISIFAGAPAGADLDASFASQWNDLTGKVLDPVAAPSPTRATIAGAAADAGLAMGTRSGQSVLVMLTTIDAGTKVVSVLVLVPSQDDLKVYMPSIQSLLGSLSVQRAAAAQAPPSDAGSTAILTGLGDINVPPMPSDLAVADLAGEWSHDDGATTDYVNASTGAYAGYNAIRTKEKWTIDGKKATVADEFFGVNVGNGGNFTVQETRKLKITLSADGDLYLKPVAGSHGAATHYLVRGWQTGADGQAVLVLNGPYYDDGIPDDVRQDRKKGWNLNEVWLRKPRKK